MPQLMQKFWDLTQSDLFKPLLPAVFFFAGVTYDSVTLTRIDRLLDNLILLLYLSILGALVILTGRFQLGLIPQAPPSPSRNVLSLVHRARPHFDKALQFLLGGLFSAYAILYSQSASFSTTSIFLVLIVLLLIGNEFLRNRYSSIKMIMTLFAMVTLSFLTFFLPVLTGWMNAWVFVTGAVLSGLIVWKIVRLILAGIPDVSLKAPMYLCLPAFMLIGLCSALYFVNWIPPIPLSMKFGGFYHHIQKTGEEYHLMYEEGPWYAIWQRSDHVTGTDHPVFAFTSVFAPVSLHTTVYHHWQWKPAHDSAPFSTTDRIPVTISGGREHGYRMYTMKQHLLPGEWRVTVETEDGRMIGRIHLQVDDSHTPTSSMTTITR
ncbi:MAG: DUF2914 domain-containing protein [Nitrospirales bacterium]|nr:DUF2914 domain-containing protein [Nitrospirales bacterium]